MANPAELLQLLVNFDLLQEAASLALEYLNAVMGHGREYFGIEVCWDPLLFIISTFLAVSTNSIKDR